MDYHTAEILWASRRANREYKTIAKDLEIYRGHTPFASFSSSVAYYELCDSRIGLRSVPVITYYPDGTVELRARMATLIPYQKRVRHIFKKYADCHLLDLTPRTIDHYRPQRFGIKFQGKAYAFKTALVIMPDGEVGIPRPYKLQPATRLPQYDDLIVKSNTLLWKRSCRRQLLRLSAAKKVRL